ncbi:MAG: aldo/keto reductase [Magnetococcales bacterium]|nr:aldo/keto reductase [Magnetococcales bacterium]
MMETRRFGKTGLRVSLLTLGTMRLLHGWDPPHDRLPEESLQSTHDILCAALDAGINLIESARGYGKSERLLGRVLPEIRRARGGAEWMIMTKAPPAPTAGEMRLWIEDSLQRLQVARLDLFALHGLNDDAQVERALSKGGPMSALRQAQSEGLIGAVGFSSHAPLPVLLRTLATGVFDFVNLHYYRLRQLNRAAVELAAALDMGVLIISPNDKGGRLYEAPEKLRRLTAPLHPVHFNERWLLAQPWVHTLSVGLSAPEQLALHLESLGRRPWWGATEKAAARRLDAAEADSGLEACGGGCTACEPCPQGINIPEVLRLLHLINAFDMDLFARYRYGLMQPGNPWVPGARLGACDGCGVCLPRCPQALPIVERLHQARQFMET